MAENLELVRQAVDVIKNETEDGANTAARVGAAMRSILEYSEEQIEKQRTSSTALSQLVVGINNRTTELEEDRNLMQKAISANSDEVENLNEVVGDWDATGNDSVAEEIGSHYAEKGDSNYDSGLWGQMRDTRSRVSKLEAGVGSNASSEEDDGSVWGQLKWHGSEIDGLHRTVANTIKSGGKINLATISSLSLAATMSALGYNEIKMYLITDSSGNLPSTSGETAITITDTAKKLLFGRTDNFAVSVGDILAVTKLTCKVIPLNEAKAANGDFPGADGLESVWDKGQINKIAGIQTTANNALPKVDRLPSRWGDNMNNALDTGVYPWCTLGRPAGSTGAYTCIVNRTSTNDGSYDTIEQTAYGRQGELGRVFKRIIFYKSDGTDTQYGEWLEITGGSGDGVLTVSSVDELPADAENGSLAVVYNTPYYTKLTEEQDVIGWDATVDDLPTSISSEDFSSISTYSSICSMNGTVGGFGFEWQGSGIIYYSGYVAGKTYQGELYADVLKNANAADVIDGISSLLEKDKSIELVITPGLEYVVYKLFPKLRYREGDIIFNIYIKTLPYGWLSPILISKEEIREELDTKLKEEVNTIKEEITAKTKNVPIVVYSDDPLPEDAELGQIAIVISAKYVNGMPVEKAENSEKYFVYKIEATADECFNDITEEDVQNMPATLYQVYYTLDGELKSFDIIYRDHFIWYRIDGNEVGVLWEYGVGKNTDVIAQFINAYNNALSGEAVYKESQLYSKQIFKWLPKLAFNDSDEDCSFAVRMNYEWYYY